MRALRFANFIRNKQVMVTMIVYSALSYIACFIYSSMARLSDDPWDHFFLGVFVFALAVGLIYCALRIWAGIYTKKQLKNKS